MDRLFVYGSLKRGESLHCYLKHETFLGDAQTVPGYSLLDFGFCPGLIIDEEATEGVKGELYEITTPLKMEELDVLEGAYKKIAIALSDGGSALTYLWPHTGYGVPCGNYWSGKI